MSLSSRLSFLFCTVFCCALGAQSENHDIYSLRRTEAAHRTGSGAIIIPGIIRTPYGQPDASSSKYFQYLTGWGSPGAWMIMTTGEKCEYTLFLPSVNASRMAWDNREPGAEEAVGVYGADKVYPMTLFREKSAEILAGIDTIWTTQTSRAVNESLAALFTDENRPVVIDMRKILNEMRMVKDSYEIGLLKKAADVTAEAQRQAMMLAAPGRYEYELEAAIEHTFRSSGCDGPGFGTIIGSGPNSSILHYDMNNRLLEAGDVIVIDIGAMYKGYTADITRTIPVTGQFTPKQLDIYNIVLEAQKEAIKEMMPGNRSLAAHDRASEIIMQGLMRLGLVTDLHSPWQKKLYILYTCTHHIGLDVHDTYPFQLTPEDEGTFSPGMVITIEPGIYFHEEMLNNLKVQYKGKPEEEEVNNFISQITPLFEEYKNIGVRIEDDILITDEGNIVISAAAPKEPQEIERLMKKKSRYE